MSNDQVAESRRVLREMNDAANRAIDAQAGPPGAQTLASRRQLDEMNNAANAAIDAQVARGTKMTPGDIAR